MVNTDLDSASEPKLEELESPILFIVFNRPDETKRVFDSIRRAKPKKLYISADGPRDGTADNDLCTLVREILANVDWECEVERNYSEVNLGCRAAVSKAITWFFDNEDEGIILEDDCLPSDSFFRYCDQSLKRFRNDQQVVCISGSRLVPEKEGAHSDVAFVRTVNIWGWATWKRVWLNYDLEMKDWPDRRNSDWLGNLFPNDPDSARYWKVAFDQAASGRINSWDYQWVYTCWLNRGLTVVPRTNLITNIGNRSNDTSRKWQQRWGWMHEVSLGELPFDLIFPPEIEIEGPYDDWSDNFVYGTKNFRRQRYVNAGLRVMQQKVKAITARIVSKPQ